MESQGAQLCREIAERHTGVCRVEEGGIRIARSQHFLVALADRIDVQLRAVGHSYKVRQQPSIAHYRKIALVFVHHGQEHGIGQPQIGGIERAQNSEGRLDEVGDLTQQVRIATQGTASAGGQGTRFKGDGRLAVAHVQHDALAHQRKLIVRDTIQSDQRRPSWSDSPGRASALHPGILKGHHAVPKQSHYPADRP